MFSNKHSSMEKRSCSQRFLHPLLNSLILFLMLVLLLLCTGCGTYVLKNPKAPFAAYADAEKINLKVGLNITDDLRKPEFKKHNLAIRPGDYLAQNCEILARHVFRQVVNQSSGGADLNALDAVLTPKLVYVNRTQGATSFGESITSIKLEWNLTDPAGKLIWLETITGEGRGSTGFSDPEKMLRKALEECLLKSQRAIASAEPIRSFSARRQAAAYK